MKCSACPETSDGFAVIPGIGDLGEIRFYCDRDARTQKVKLRYWDGRDLEIGGWRENPDLGKSFYNVVFSFEDLARMRTADLQALLQWVDDKELALSLLGSDSRLLQRVYRAVPPDRARRIRDLQDDPHLPSEVPGGTPQGAREAIVDMVRKL
ncbi:MAG: hypothetical protein HYY17_05850 [Planctomycetes bacterium]|nr:hypothetical protein [Planctomycetota bacterium]